MLLLGARYGLRISDIRTLKLTDVDFAANRIHIVQQKTGKPLTLDLLPDVGWALIDYLKYGRPQVDAAEIFLHHVHPYGPLGEADNSDLLKIKKPVPSFRRNRLGWNNRPLQKRKPEIRQPGAGDLRQKVGGTD